MAEDSISSQMIRAKSWWDWSAIIILKFCSMIRVILLMMNDPPLLELKILTSTDAGAAMLLLMRTLWDLQYQRRTQKGTGRTEKTVHRGAAKNPRLLKACNITK